MNCSTSYRKRIRTTAISIITFALGLGLILTSHAQSNKSEANPRDLNITRTAAVQETLPVAITVFPDEVIRAQETWARRAFRNLIYFHEADRGGHFAMWEHPQLFSEEIRSAFRSLR